MSTPMPRHHDPFRRTPSTQVSEKVTGNEDKEREREKEPTSARGTIKGAPTVLKQETELAADKLKEALDTPFEEPKEPASFEEPKVDEFGTGHGI